MWQFAFMLEIEILFVLENFVKICKNCKINWFVQFNVDKMLKLESVKMKYVSKLNNWKYNLLINLCRNIQKLVLCCGKNLCLSLCLWALVSFRRPRFRRLGCEACLLLFLLELFWFLKIGTKMTKWEIIIIIVWN